MKVAPPPKPRRSSSAAPQRGRAKDRVPAARKSNAGGRASKVNKPPPAPVRRKASTAVVQHALKRPAATKAAVVKHVLKRPAAAASAPTQVLKRPAAASMAPMLKRPAAKVEKAGVEVDANFESPKKTRGKKLACAPETPEQFNSRMFLEDLVNMEVNKFVMKRPASDQLHMRPAPTTPLFSASPTAPASYASAWSPSGPTQAEMFATRSEQAQTRAQMRAAKAPPPRPKSWGLGDEEDEVEARRRRNFPKSPVTSKPRGRGSLGSSSLFGDVPTEENLNDLAGLPSEEQCRLQSDVPGILFKRAQKRRASASQDLRSVAAQQSPARPPASPTRQQRTSFGVFDSSPSRNTGATARPSQSPNRNLSRAPSWAPAPEPSRRLSVGSACPMSPCTPGGATTESRMEDGMNVASRILGVRKQRFASQVEWAFSVLGKPRRDLLSVQKAYRDLMRPLHPDRAGSQAEVGAAVDLVREAKDLCERALRQQDPPDRPSRLNFTHVCTEPGRRRFKLSWRAPENRESAPVHRYIVAVFDPSYGRALSVGTLEPDYSQEFKRYLAYDDPELCSYTVSEEDLKKMPNLFKSDVITVQVAAGNNEGQSDWSILKVRLTAATGRASVSGPGRVSVGSISCVSTDGDFDRFVQGKKGRELESWLQIQKKEMIQGWLKRRCQQVSGSKEAVVQRIIKFKEDNPW